MRNKPKVILVTGAAGMIGGALTEELLARNCHVLAADCVVPTPAEKYRGAVEWLKLDVTDSQFTEVLDSYKIDEVIHAAAHPGGRSLLEPTKDVEVNALGSMRIFEYCARRRLPIVFTSSSIVYGEQPYFPISEDVSPNPGTIYGVCKVACENYLRILGKGYGLPWTILRLFATYGAGHKPSSFQGIVNVMLGQLLAGDRVVVRGSLERIRDLVYVKDAARGVVDALFSNEARGKIVNLGTGDPVSIRRMIETLILVMGRRPETIELVEETGTEGDVQYSSADCRLARGLFGYVPRFSLEAGLIDLLEARNAYVGAGREV
jgi:UDP-glucose 4-epimerase